MAASQNPANIHSGRDRRRTWVAGSVVLVTASMLGLSFAAVPLYRIFCARTGFAGTTQLAKVAPMVKGKRTLIVRFDTNVAPGLAWRFVPETPQVKLLTGQTATVFFKVTNLSENETAAQAVYNVAPGQTGGYFDKIACFCFKEQHLGPHESMEMPVVFFLDPALEHDETMNGIEEVTLSYTFYPAPTGAPVAAAGESGSGSRL
ncbi:MAG TPA: cytochrome c oxidase assembly protein [Methylovirgula sp.]|nr:cytochrome c oxidase assembly protein [Methylovirgula sp.]